MRQHLAGSLAARLRGWLTGQAGEESALAAHIAEQQVIEIVGAVKRTRVPGLLVTGICMSAAIRWPQAHWVLLTGAAVLMMILGSRLLLPRMGRTRVHYANTTQELRAYAIFATLSALWWAALFAEMIIFAPMNERVGWIALDIMLITIGTGTFAMVPRASSLYCLIVGVSLWITILVEPLNMPIATKLLMPVFAFLIRQANMRNFHRFRSHLVAEWTLRRHQEAREAEQAMARARETEEQAQARQREHEAEQAARDQRAALAEQKRQNTLEIADSYERSVVAHALELEQVVGGLVDAIERINHAGVAVRTSADRMLGLAADSTGATQALADSTERLSLAADNIGEQVLQQRAAAAASDQAGEAAQTSLDALSHETDRIGEIVELVQSLAAQTNLLALNAAIEAARAGAAGRGFAVVASEVKQLASQTHGAIGRVGEIVTATRSRMKEMQDSMMAIARSAEDAAERAAHIVGAVDNQRQATRTIGQAADSTAGIAGELRVVAEQVVTDIGSTNHHVQNIKEAMVSLRIRSQALRETSDTFLAQLRSAAG